MGLLRSYGAVLFCLRTLIVEACVCDVCMLSTRVPIRAVAMLFTSTFLLFSVLVVPVPPSFFPFLGIRQLLTGY